jgi:ABC-type phosphate/phosphonate transport system substrate-binding protein
MISRASLIRRPRVGSAVAALGLSAILLIAVAAADSLPSKPDVLRIGTSGTLTGPSESKEEAGLKTLREFIKEETGLENEIVRQKNWQELTHKMATGDLHIGVFQGYEFAWGVEGQPKLRPLAIAVNVYRYPVVYVVTRRDSQATRFANLKGQSIAVPATSQAYLRLFVERQSEATGQKADVFFSHITEPDNVEDALDAAVDGKVQAVAVDRAALEAYKQRKPGRFKRLKEVTHSQPFPPPIVAYYDSNLDQSTLNRYKQGLLGASNKEKGQTLLTLFRLSRFETVPDDFDKALAEARKAYPPTTAASTSK